MSVFEQSERIFWIWSVTLEVCVENGNERSQKLMLNNILDQSAFSSSYAVEEQVSIELRSTHIYSSSHGSNNAALNNSGLVLIVCQHPQRFKIKDRSL